MRYSEKEMARLYRPDEYVTFGRGRLTMRAEEAERYTYGLVELDNPTGLYRRLCPESGAETATIEAKMRDRLKAGAIGPSPWSPSHNTSRTNQ